MAFEQVCPASQKTGILVDKQSPPTPPPVISRDNLRPARDTPWRLQGGRGLLEVCHTDASALGITKFPEKA